MMKFFLAVLVLSLASTGCWGCELTDIEVGQGPSGRKVGGKTEWTVIVENRCECNIGGVSLWCKDFESVEAVDPTRMIRSADGRCLIGQGKSLKPFDIVGFKYAWDKPATFTPRDFVNQC